MANSTKAGVVLGLQQLLAQQLHTEAASVQVMSVEVGVDGVLLLAVRPPLLGVPFSFDTRPADLAEFAGKFASFNAETGEAASNEYDQRFIAGFAQNIYNEAKGLD